MIIDTHLHVWSDDAERYPFAEGRTQVGGGSVELLNQTMDEVGVDKAVIVQPIYYLFDNRYVAACLRRFPGRFAAIGLVDPKAPDAPDRLEKLVREDGFGGLRIHSSRLDHPSEWAAPDQDLLWRRSEELGTCFIVHGPAANLPHLEPIIGRFPEVPVVLDHIGGAPTDEEPPFSLLRDVLNLARFPKVYVKLTPPDGGNGGSGSGAPNSEGCWSRDE
ncbi:MAG: amidohydrolase family protein [Gemmatimonadetes bacterium]|nr:amidohydrolase family protein [Gemmatimonadota bacterium]